MVNKIDRTCMSDRTDASTAALAESGTSAKSCLRYWFWTGTAPVLVLSLFPSWKKFIMLGWPETGRLRPSQKLDLSSINRDRIPFRVASK
jgi:hypothetical protein